MKLSTPILTITLSPAMDTTITLPNLKLGSVNRIKKSQSDFGGKGINVSKSIATLGGKTIATGFLGGDTGKKIINMMRASQSDDKNNYNFANNFLFDFVMCTNETRTNIKVLDEMTNNFTDMNELSASISKNEWNLLLNKITEIITNNQNSSDQQSANEQFIVMGGSIPDSLGTDTYLKLINHINHNCNKNIKIIVDTSGKALKSAIAAKPFLIKPNIDEISEITEQNLYLDERNEEINFPALIKAAKSIIQNGVEIVVISLGKHGLMWVDDLQIFHASAPKVQVKSTVGAGDSLLGGITLGLSRSLGIEEILRIGTAAGTAAVTTEGTSIPNADFINQLILNVQVKKMNI